MGTAVDIFKITFYLFVYFVYIGPLSTSSSSDELCHKSCFCLDTFFDCRKRGLTTFPDDFPSWVQKLNLSNNEISSIEGTQASRLHQLQALSLDANNFTSIPLFGAMPQLQHLSLARNNISQIESQPLSSLTSIHELDLSRNRIEALSNSSFPVGLPIRTLNLGFNLIEVLLPGWFDSLPELIDLNIAKNKLKILSKETFIQLKNLERLDLSRNKLEMIESLRFQELKKLQLLNLRRNHMTNLSDAAFYGLEKIQHLYLDGNNIKFVEKRWLYGLCSLKSLNLSKNDIGKIDDDSWEFMEELQMLDISSNKLTELKVLTLMGLSKLRYLDLSFNQISEIEKDSFLTMGNLEILDLSNNELSWVLEDMPNTFKGLSECQSVNLAHNKIRSLHPEALRGLPNLLTLNLTSNPIKWLSEKSFQDLSHASLILWDIESLVCDCHSLWLRSRITQPTLKGKSRHRDFDRKGAKKSNANKSVGSLTCAYPPSLRNQNLVDVPVENLTCSENSMRPQFLEEPETEIFLMEGNGSLSCRVQSFADLPLSLIWKVDRKDLPKHLESQVSNMHRLEENGATTINSTLKLANVSWNHKGLYQCIAENSLGVAYTANANVTVHVFPTFIKKPSNVTVRLGYNAKLECAAKGFPSPEIAFHKDGGEDFPAALDRRFHVMPNDDSFFIMEVKLIDMGVYCCSARNAAGEIKAYATVTVYETPSFSDPMEDENALEGNNAILSCLANGSPKPQLTWTKDGVMINDGMEKRFHLTENGSLLLIKDVQRSDAGRYECLLSNAVGTTRGFSTLSVLPNNGGKMLHLDPSAMTIIFIIIAVFCVVGTSAAWVVVIYRTRKRNKPPEARHMKYDDDDNRPGFSGNIVPFSTNCQLAKASICHDSDSQSSSAKDSGTGDDIPPETDPMAIVDIEQESLMRRSRNKQELESFSTFGTRASSTRMLDARISQVRLDLQNDVSDVIMVRERPSRDRRVTKVSVPVPPEKELTAERRSTCPSNSSSSGYSSSGTRNYPGKVGHSNKERSDSVNSEELESLQDHASVEEVTCISTPV